MAGIGSYKPIKLFHYEVTKNASGDNEEAITERKMVWAEVVDFGGSRSEERGKTNLSDTKSFKIRFRVDWVLNGDWRLKYYGKVYAVTKIERIDEKRFNWLITAIDKS